MKKVLLLAVSFLLLASGFLTAEDKIETKISGVVYANYNYVFSENLLNGAPAADFNGFDISRIHLNAQSKFNDNLGSFAQLEGNLITARLSGRADVANYIYLKQAYLEYKEIYPSGTLYFGLISNPWVDYELALWKNRYIARTLADEDIGIPTTDRGVKLKGSVSMLAYEAIVVNGEGTGARGTTGNEVNKYKDAALKLSLSPFESDELKGLKISGYVHQGYSVVDAKRNRTFGAVSYESAGFNIMGAYYMAETGATAIKGAGYSLNTNYKIGSRWVFGKYDRYDTNTDTADDAYSKILLGVSQKLAENVKIALAYGSYTFEKEVLSPAGAGMANQKNISTNLEIKF